MIKVTSSLDLSAMAGAIDRLKKAAPPANSTQPMPGQDTIQSGNARESEAVRTPPATMAEREAVYERPSVASRVKHAPAPTEQNVEDDSPSMLERMNASFLLGSGDEGFDSGVDLNSDGRINFQDMKMLKEQMTPAEPSVVQRMNDAFFLSSGDEGYDAGLDLNEDGIINFGDMVMLRAQLAAESESETIQPAPPASNPPQNMTAPAQPAGDQLRVDGLSAAGLEPAPAASIPPQYMNAFPSDAIASFTSVSAKDDAAMLLDKISKS